MRVRRGIHAILQFGTFNEIISALWCCFFVCVWCVSSQFGKKTHSDQGLHVVTGTAALSLAYRKMELKMECPMSTLLWGRKRNGWWEMSSLYNIRNKHAHWRTIRFLLHHYKFSLAGEAIAYYSAYLLEKIAACCLDKRKCTAAQLWYHKLDFPEIWNISGSAQINRPAS